MIRRLFSLLNGMRLGHLVLAGCLAATACADMSTMTPAQQALEQSKRRFIATTAEGAVGGALLGALIGGVAGGGRGALIGAGAGAVAGGVAGAVVAQNNYQRSRSESNLNAAVADANEQAALARRDASLARQIASEARAKAGQLRSQYAAGQINANQYRAGLASFQSSLKALQDISRGQADQIAVLRQNASIAPGRSAQTLRSQSGDIASSKAEIDGAVSDLIATIQAAPA